METAAAAAAVTQTLGFLRSLGNKIPPEVLEAITDAYSHALASQQEQLELIKRVQELEGTIAEYDNWETEKDRYEGHQIESGGFVYRLRKECKQDTGPDHCICPNCYEDRRKSILQMTRNPASAMHFPVSKYFLFCLKCKAEIPCPRDIFAAESSNS